MKRGIVFLIVGLLFLCNVSLGDEIESISVLQTDVSMIGLQPVSLYPEDYSGFCMALCVDQVNLNSTKADRVSDDGRVCYFDLTEKECRELLQNAKLLSIGPDKSVLWATSGERTMFVQHGKTLVILMQAINRGINDNTGLFADNIRYKLMTSPQLVMGEVRWSPDGRYIFLNETGKWFGAQFDIEDPYLIDTITGELFLIESDGIKKSIMQDNFQYVAGGRFSQDSEYFYYYMRGKNRHVIKQYNLNTGSVIEVYESSAKRFHDFCEIGAEKLFVIEENDIGIEVVRIANSQDVKRDSMTVPSGANVSIIPLNSNNALLKADYVYKVSSLMFVQWDQSIIDEDWYVISNDLDGSLIKKTASEIEEINKELIFDNVDNLSPYRAYISKILALPEEDKYVINAEINRKVHDTWDGMIQRLYGFFLLDNKNRTVSLVQFGNMDYTLGNDAIAYGSAFLVGEGDSEAYWFIGLDSAEFPFSIIQSDEYLEIDKTYSCSTGCYLNDVKGLSPAGIKTRNIELTSSITEYEDYLLIKTVFAKNVEQNFTYILPYAISEERYIAFANKLSKKDKKKLANYYSLIEPAKLQKKINADYLMACYPNVVVKPIYILKTGLHEDALIKAEQYFHDAGYTEEDYEIDLQEVNLTKFKEISKSIYYSFYSITDSQYTSTEMLLLAGLCDKINSRVYKDHFNSGDYVKSNTDAIENKVVSGILQKRDSEEMNEESVRQLIQERYYIDNAIYTVVIEDVEETDEALTINLKVKCD